MIKLKIPGALLRGFFMLYKFKTLNSWCYDIRLRNSASIASKKSSVDK